jgi:hypothetical protein
MRRITLAPVLALVAILAVQPPAVLGHGDEESAPADARGGGEQPLSPEQEEALEVRELSEEPARVLAQQAIALLEIRGDVHEAEVRIEAAEMSEDQADVDTEALEEAHDALAAGDVEAAVEALDRALSRPLGAESGKSLHKAELTAERGDDTQETVAIIAGAALLLLGFALLAPRRARAA